VVSVPSNLSRPGDHAVPEVEAMASEPFHYFLRLSTSDPVEARLLAREKAEEFFPASIYEVQFGSAPGHE